MEYIIPGVLLQGSKRQKLWNSIFHFNYSEVKVICEYHIKKLSLFTLGTNLLTKLD